MLRMIKFNTVRRCNLSDIFAFAEMFFFYKIDECFASTTLRSLLIFQLILEEIFYNFSVTRLYLDQ